MSTRLSLVCWQPVLTAHQSATFEGLQAQPGVELLAVTSRADNPGRPGWFEDRVGDTPVELLPARGPLARIRALLGHGERVHIFATPFDPSRVSVALALALARRLPVFLIAEPYSTASAGYFDDRRRWLSAAKRRLRPWLYRAYGKLLAGRITGVFAISPRAVAQFRDMGVPADRVFPFGYFVRAEPVAQRAARLGGAPLRCAFVGSLIERKGLDTLLGAFAASDVLRGGATLDIYGPGSLGDRPLPANVAMRGRLPEGAVRQAMADADLVLVPSLFDGWGVVVNEAIQAGTPVVASDAVGAAATVVHWRCGETFPAGDAVALRGVLERLAQDRHALERMRDAARALAPELDPAVAGRYMHACITASLDGAPAPAAPWYSVAP